MFFLLTYCTFCRIASTFIILRNVLKTCKILLHSQKYKRRRKPFSSSPHLRRRLPQLSPRVSVGLQGCRAGKLFAKLEHGIYRPIRQDWLGVRHENRDQRDCGATRQANRRRLAFERERSLGLGRSRYDGRG